MSMNSPMRRWASPRSRKIALSTHSRQSVPQKRSILPSVCGRRGVATICLMPRFSSSLVKALLPRQVTYWAAVVGEDLLGRAVAGQAGTQHFDRQGGRLTGVQPVADDEPAVVVHERHQVRPCDFAA